MLKIVVVLAIVACIHAAPSNHTLEKSPGKSKDGKGCYIQGLDAVLAVGEKGYSSKPCVEYTCLENGFSGLTCASEYGPPPCKLVVIDENKLYPECCPRWICP